MKTVTLIAGANAAIGESTGRIVVSHAAVSGIDVNLTAFLLDEKGAVEPGTPCAHSGRVDSLHHTEDIMRGRLAGALVVGLGACAELQTGGNIGGDLAEAMTAPATNGFRGFGALIPQTSTMSIAAIDKRLGLPGSSGKNIESWGDLKDEVIHPALNSVLNPEFALKRVLSTWLPFIPGVLNMMQRAVEAEDIKNRLDPVKINKIDMMLVEWKSAVEDRWAQAEKAFDALGSDVMYPATLMPNVNAMTPKEAIAPIHRAALAQQTRVTLDLIGRMQKGMTWYKETGTTDNQWILKNPRVAAYRGLKLQVSS